MAHQTSEGSIRLRDGIQLRYTQVGPENGPGLLLIAGWRQTAAQWKKQVDHFAAAGFRVTTYDHRSQGESEKTSNGLRISSLAVDLLHLLRELNLKNIQIVAHSMACCVTWCLWDLFPEECRERINSIVFVDQSACLTPHPSWTPQQAMDHGAIFTPEALHSGTKDMAVQGIKLLRSMFVDPVDSADVDWAIQQNLKMSAEDAATLLLDHATIDWRDVLPKVDIPVLVIAAEGSVLPVAGVQWIATQMPKATLETFRADEGGSHFMFWQNPTKFNQVVEKFVTAHKSS